MTFCPECGASLRTVQPQAEARTTTYRRNEKEEKEEKGEKREKHEKRQYSFVGPLIGGLILIFIGLTSYLKIIGYVEESGLVWALFFVVIGLLIVVGGIYAAMIAGRRHPRP
jgi:hypothetical protein